MSSLAGGCPLRSTLTGTGLLGVPAALALAALVGCATPIRERVYFASDMNSLQTLGSGPADGVVSQPVAAPASRVNRAARFVLQQRALVFHAAATAGDATEYRYLDRSSFRLGALTVPVEMVFSLRVEPAEEGKVLLKLVCHWDAMTDERYHKEATARFDALKSSMLSEAVITLDRIQRQSLVAGSGTPVAQGAAP
jgi:hypothetical protein